MKLIKKISKFFENPTPRNLTHSLFVCLILFIIYLMVDLNKINPIFSIFLMTIFMFSIATSIHILLSFVQKYLENKYGKYED